MPEVLLSQHIALSIPLAVITVGEINVTAETTSLIF